MVGYSTSADLKVPTPVHSHCEPLSLHMNLDDIGSTIIVVYRWHLIDLSDQIDMDKNIGKTAIFGPLHRFLRKVSVTSQENYR